ncbi:MAG TPA: tetratricopeptide repeat protein [Candidatus Polarisedimenticolia bacterium]|nr:tetratricopeptide repeat protein [Candidatus Polarisedimenticolia bacterium]
MKLLVLCAVCVPLGALQAVSAQTVGVTRKHVSSDPAARELNRLLAAAQEAVDQKDYATAAQKYQDYLAKKPNDAIVHYDLGYAYTAMQRPADAKAEYEKAISLDSKMAPAYLNLGLTLLASDPGAAVEPLQHAVELMPEEGRPLFLLGAALERSGKLGAAIERYEAAEKLDHRDFDIHFSLGRALLNAQRAPEAERAFRSALVSRPEASEARLGLAQSLLAEKKLEAAAAELGAYLVAQPNDASARVERAGALVDTGRLDEALAELDRAAATGAEGLRALELRSQIYFAEKRYADAVPALQKAAAIAPGDKDIPALLGHAYLEAKNYPDALRELNAAYRMDPNANDVLGDLVLAEYNNRHYAEALDALELLSKRKELPPESWFIRAACYDKLGQPAQALEAYQRFLQLNKDENSDMYFESASRVRALSREVRKKGR